MAEPVLASNGVIRVRAASASDRGRVRSGNEDRVYLDVTRGVFAVVDGVGGHAAGEVAATIAVDVIGQRLARPLWSPAQCVREAIALANNEILAQASAQPDRAGMTCVLTLALLTDTGVTVGHVGDTRLYRLDGDGLRKLTHDHSPIGEREDAGELGEAEAMRHPRRNEVFRDVGSVFHEPDDPDFIELVEAPFDERSALLLCSDGLSDMLAATAIERVVREHAGNPQRVVEALVLAANEAGGRDNVSVVYVEGNAFAPRVAGTDPAPRGNAAALPVAPSAGRRFSTSPALMLATGLVAGLALGLSLAWMLAIDDPAALAGPRTLEVGTTPDSPYLSIAAAMAVAAPRDTIRLAPGEYAETVVLADGVNLVARDHGTAVLLAPPGAPAGVALTVGGRLGHVIRGLTIAGTALAPLDVGLRLAGHDVTVDDVTVAGTMNVGIEIVNDGAIAIRASRLSGVTGLPLRIGPAARPVVQRSVFEHRHGGAPVAVAIAPDAMPDLTDNIFLGYRNVVDGDMARREEVLKRNLVLGEPPAAPRGAGR